MQPFPIPTKHRCIWCMWQVGMDNNGTMKMMDAFRWSISSSFDLRQICCDFSARSASIPCSLPQGDRFFFWFKNISNSAKKKRVSTSLGEFSFAVSLQPFYMKSIWINAIFTFWNLEGRIFASAGRKLTGTFAVAHEHGRRFAPGRKFLWGQRPTVFSWANNQCRFCSDVGRCGVERNEGGLRVYWRVKLTVVSILWPKCIYNAHMNLNLFHLGQFFWTCPNWLWQQNLCMMKLLKMSRETQKSIKASGQYHKESVVSCSLHFGRKQGKTDWCRWTFLCSWGSFIFFGCRTDSVAFYEETF